MLPMTNENNEKLSQKQFKKFVMFALGKQKFGILAEKIRDVILRHDITPIPLAPKEVIGSINIRGRIVTALSLMAILEIENKNSSAKYGIVIEQGESLYCFVVDAMYNVMDIVETEIENTPGNISTSWKERSLGVLSKEDEVIVLLDTDKIFSFYQ